MSVKKVDIQRDNKKMWIILSLIPIFEKIILRK